MARSPVVEVENTSLPPGGETRITVSVSNITEAIMYPPTGGWTIEYGTVSPRPQITRKSMPPIWEWASPQPEVTIEASLSAAEEVAPRDYYYSVRVRTRDRDSDDWTVNTGVITVTDPSTS